MKNTLHLIIVVLLFVLAGAARTQDEQAKALAFLFTGSNECEIVLTITVSDNVIAPILLTLAEGGQVVDQQFAPYTFRLPVGRTDYTLLAEYVPEDANAYAIDGHEDCPPAADAYDALEAEIFRRMNWSEEEIAWFRQTYSANETGIFGSQRDYIYAVADLYKQLDEAQPPEPLPTPEPTPEATTEAMP